MSYGGTGDVMAGVMSALRAQKLDMMEACMSSVAGHARAGTIVRNATGEIGWNASLVEQTSRALLNK